METSALALASGARRGEWAARSWDGAVRRELVVPGKPVWSWRWEEVRGGATGGMCRRRSDAAAWYSGDAAVTGTGEDVAARELMGELACEGGAGLFGLALLPLFLREARREDEGEAVEFCWLA